MSMPISVFKYYLLNNRLIKHSYPRYFAFFLAGWYTLLIQTSTHVSPRSCENQNICPLCLSCSCAPVAMTAALPMLGCHNLACQQIQPPCLLDPGVAGYTTPHRVVCRQPEIQASYHTNQLFSSKNSRHPWQRGFRKHLVPFRERGGRK